VRWFIALLVVANVVLFFWVQQQSRPLPGSMALPPPDVGRLRLMTELKEDPPAGGAGDAIVPPVELSPIPVEEEAAIPPVSSFQGDPMATAPAVDSAQSPVIVDTGTAAIDAASPEVEVAPEPADQPIHPVTEQVEAIPVVSVTVPAGAGIVEDEISETTDQVDAPLPEPKRVATLAQENETGVAENGQTDLQPEEVSASGDLQPGNAIEPEDLMAETIPGPVLNEVAPALCTRVGPFDPEDADRLISKLPVSITLLSDFTEEYSSVDRYYVLIPPLPSRAAGRQKLKELANAGVTDTWLFPSGEYRNAISLGFFSREGGARRHAANMAKKGFAAEVREKTSVRERRWLFLKDANGGAPGSGMLLPEGVIVEQKTCP
jgi:hypothetical protein